MNEPARHWGGGEHSLGRNPVLPRTVTGMRIRPLPTILLAALWGAVYAVLLVVGFGLLIDVAELFMKAADEDCGCAQDPPFTTTLSGVATILPVGVPVSAVLWAVVGVIGWLVSRRGGASGKRAAWLGASVSLGLAVVFFAVTLIASGLDTGWGRLEWETILPSALIAVLLAPFAGLAGWIIVHLARVREPSSNAEAISAA